MNEQSTKIVVVATIVLIAVASGTILLINTPDQDTLPNSSDVTSIYILGNSSDIVYPELMDVMIEYTEEDGWVVTANFVDDSEGWENPEIYDRTFSLTNDDVIPLSEAFSAGVNLTSPCEDDKDTILESNAHIGFQVLVTYADGTWSCVWMLQTESGHLLFNSGTGSPNQNMLDADLLQPVSAFNSFIDVVEQVFLDNMNG